MSNAATSSAVRAALAKLPPRSAQVLILLWAGGATVANAQKLYGISRDALAVKVRRALAEYGAARAGKNLEACSPDFEQERAEGLTLLAAVEAGRALPEGHPLRGADQELRREAKALKSSLVPADQVSDESRRDLMRRLALGALFAAALFMYWRSQEEPAPKEPRR